jgi:hypothetical protein
VAGGNFYYNNRVAIALRGDPLIWFNVDEEGYKLLNLKLFDHNGNLRVHIEDNIWQVKAGVNDIECPPSGKELKLYLDNGDNIRMRFNEVNSEEDFNKFYPGVNSSIMTDEYPFSALNVALKLKTFNIDFQERKTSINGNKGIILMNNFMKNNGTGLSL